MKGKNLFNTTPIKMIRTVKGITVDKMAYYFEVGQSYITMIDNEERSFKTQTLKNGLNNLGVTMEQYNEITEFREFLENRYTDELLKDSHVTGFKMALEVFSYEPDGFPGEFYQKLQKN